MRILVVEDDEAVGKLIRATLVAAGYAVDFVTTGEEGRLLAFVNAYDGILLDLGLSDRHGLTIVQELRREGKSTPILILTGQDDESTIVRALDAGADEYVVKPVRPRELVARVRALVRRVDRPQAREQLVAGAIVMNRLTRQVFIGGRVLSVSPRELSLLEQFMLHAGEVISRAELLERVWDMHFDPSSNVIDVHVNRLRRKLEGAEAGVEIQTRRGVGFMLVAGGDGAQGG
ncbi:MAG TPA: response regulator transcription factor [Gemmatimonadaceae bacterium]|nr:response regulator transcription factor [Gemmatimonadaceae bacterium]